MSLGASQLLSYHDLRSFIVRYPKKSKQLGLPFYPNYRKYNALQDSKSPSPFLYGKIISEYLYELVMTIA